MKFPYLLRPDQTQALHELVENDHLIFIAPTGSGKSILFQKYIFDRPGIRAVLISPLNALSRQQSERFQNLGIPTFHHQPPRSDQHGVWIMSPEKVQGRVFDQLRSWSPQFLIVDEAHCVWEWGQRFRPAYRRILQLVEFESVRKSLWCSATLPPQSLQRLTEHLKQLPRNRVQKWGRFALPTHLTLRVEKVPPECRLQWLRNTLGFYADQSGMVFCNTRASAVSLQKHLHYWGIRSIFYHAGLSIEEKLNLEKMLRDPARSQEPMVVVATSAFGMGMDYDFFRFCILFEPSFTILSLVQAIGRVGRVSGSVVRSARAHVLWHPDDFIRNRDWVDQSEVRQWCQLKENPSVSLENYFNGVPLSGSIGGDEYTGSHSIRSETVD
jgi:ATP-dependent DNA helicase RecQ